MPADFARVGADAFVRPREQSERKYLGCLVVGRMPQ
jgi:hypothetical protein